MKIFIVGGSSGIGLSLAKRYASLGNEVAICGTNEEKLKKIEQSNNNIKIYKVFSNKGAYMSFHLSTFILIFYFHFRFNFFKLIF